MITLILMIHGLLAVALLGAITHQAYAVATRRNDSASRPLLKHGRAADAAIYANAICVLAVLVIVLGGSLYPDYRLVVRPVLQAQGQRAPNGAFEIKEHFAALMLLLLPAYWAVWRQTAIADYAGARAWLTWIFAFIVWWNFLVGELLVIIKGLFL